MLAKLAAWYLQRRVKGIVCNSTPQIYDPTRTIQGWIFGENWYIVVNN